jgi:hypothetical protein
LRNRLARRNARYRRMQASGEFGAGIDQGGAVVAGGMANFLIIA